MDQRHCRRGSTLVKVVGSVIALAVIGGGVWYGSTQVTLTESTATNDIVAASVQDFDIQTIATGELEARQQVEIRNKLDSRATLVSIIAEGTRVSEGDVLFVLNSESIEEQITEEESRVETARADLEAAENAYLIRVSDNDSNLRAANLELELAELAYQQWRDGDDPKELERLQADLDSAQRNHKRLSGKFEQSTTLFERDFKSLNDYEQEEIQLLEAVSRVKQAQLALDTYKSYQRPRDEKQRSSDVEEAKAKVERVRKQNAIELSSKDASRKNARRQLELRTDRLAKLNEQLSFCEVRAPNDGLVVYNSSTRRGRWNSETPEPGMEIRPNEVVIVLPDTGEMVASVRVHESLAGRLRPGQSATVKIEALDSASLPGTVESIGVLAESGNWRDPNLREYTVRVLLEPGELAKQLKPSMRAEATIVLDRVDEALTVPVQSVFSDGRLRYVYRPVGPRFQRVPVQLGRRSETQAEVLAGLAAVDRVLTRTPDTGEVLTGGWDEAGLQAVGYRLDEDGQPVPDRGSRGRPSRTTEASAAEEATSETPVAAADADADGPVGDADTITTPVSTTADGEKVSQSTPAAG
ncbi:MAG: HlyD family efflux transporter periplasmic adaptor subunit [Phycisphaerales bacterium]